MVPDSVPRRARRLLYFFLFFFLCILARVWYLSVACYDSHLAIAKRPLHKVAVDLPDRGTIRDRFNLPLAQNRVKFNAAISYEQIRQIPTVQWERDERGKKRRVLARRNYIQNLSQFLAHELGLSPGKIEDLIHGKASLFPHTSFVLKEDISETLYYRLKFSERTWPGIAMQQTSERFYPRGKTACDVIGYIGSISEEEYLKIGEETLQLREFLSEWRKGTTPLLPKGFQSIAEVEERLAELAKNSYTRNDLVGKCGIEASCDHLLRGQRGLRHYELGVGKGVEKALPGGTTVQPGERIILSLSAELQEEAEQLLAEYELLQEEQDKRRTKVRPAPWQRGGAIVAMIPQTGEVVAFASHPRFDPNDFTPAQTAERKRDKRGSILKWLESESHIGAIWDGKEAMERERYSSADKGYYTEALSLTWSEYLGAILSKKSALYHSILGVNTVKEALEIQKALSSLLDASGALSVSTLLDLLSEEIPLSAEAEVHRAALSPFLDPIPNPRDKLLFFDLLQLAVFSPSFTSALSEKCASLTIEQHRAHAAILARYAVSAEGAAKEGFLEGPFAEWRRVHFPLFLAEKRKEERDFGHFPKPYLDLLEKEERKQFGAYWDQHKIDLFVQSPPDELSLFLESLTKEEQKEYLLSLRSFSELTRPLLGSYPQVRKKGDVQLEKDLAAAFYPYTGFGYGRSQAFRAATPLGSLFKFIPAYAGLKQKFLEGEEEINPLTLIDDMQWTSVPGSNGQVLGRFKNGETIKRYYKGGVLPRAYPGIGEIDVVGAIERTSNIYFSILAGDVLHSPSDLLQAATAFGYGTKTGIDLPFEYPGELPTDLSYNRTGLYSFAIGQHSLIVTPLQAATALAALANGGSLVKPQILKLSAGTRPSSEADRLFSLTHFPKKESLSLLGIPFPLFTETLSADEKGYISFQKPLIRSEIFLPSPIRETLLAGMKKVISGAKGSARPAIIRRYLQCPAAIESYQKVHAELAGKTGTAEILFKPTIDAESEAQMVKHVWFGGISFKGEEPDLVVAVYLRFGSAGSQAAPLAARIIDKWREIKKQREIGLPQK